MDYSVLVKSEDTDIYHISWTKYRNEVTDFIIEAIESYYIKSRLKQSGKKRLSSYMDMKAIVEKLGKKPTLAIWGAGGCNDIDVRRLANYFRLVLIDHNLDKISSVREKYGFSEKECVCIDLKFWDFTETDYLMIEALIKDRVDRQEIEKYINKLVESMDDISGKDIPHFDFSIVAGLTSQLNSRFAALFHINEYPHNMYEFLSRINHIAVSRLLNVIMDLTEKLIIFGYEKEAVLCDEVNRLEQRISNLNDEIFSNQEEVFCLGSRIAGNDCLTDGLNDLVQTGSLISFYERYMEWNFINEKSYLMHFVSFEKTFKISKKIKLCR